MLPLDELKALDSEVEHATELGTLKPIFYRVAEIARQFEGDLDVQLSAAELRQHIIDKGLVLRHPVPNGSSPVAAKEPATTSPTQPARLVVVELPPPTQSAPAPPRPSRPFNLRRAIIFGAGLGIAAWLIIFVVLVQIARNRNISPKPVQSTATATTGSPVVSAPVAGGVPVDIATNPPGAAIRINGESKCKSNCRVNLAPGNYQVTAVLDGFDPAATGVTVVAGNPLNVSLTLPPQGQTVRLFTDLEAAKAVVDAQPAVDIQDGQLVIDRVQPGKHSVRVLARNGEAQFAFDAAPGKQAAITGRVTANNVLAVIVTSAGTRAYLQSSSPVPLPVALNGLPLGDAGEQGLELKDVPPGDQTLTVGSGSEQRKLVVPFAAAPALTAFLKSDVNTGTLVVSTGEDDATVFLNGKAYPRKTRRGELRIQTLGKVTVRVAKNGYQPEPEQKVEIKKGEETKLAFHLTALPKVGALKISGAVPGTLISLDDRELGRVGPDGALSAANLPAGEHSIEAKRDGFLPRRISRNLKAGEALLLSGGELTLQAAVATVHLVVSPSDAVVNYRRADDSQSHLAQDATLKLPAGEYVFTVRAPNFVERSERAAISAGESRNIDIALAREPKVAVDSAKPVPMMNWAGWSRQGSEYVRKGGDRVVLRSGRLPGTITFTAHLRKAGGLFHGGKLRWFVEDGNGYSVFEIDKKKFLAKGPEGSRAKDHSRDRGEESGEQKYTIQIDIQPDRIVHRMRVGGSWITLDSQPAAGEAEGRFGFLIPGNEEIGISDLQVTPR